MEGALKARAQWAETPLELRAAVFLKAADLLATKYRPEIMAATMLGQGKTVWQAEIDAAGETIDFFRFNVKFAEGTLPEELHSLHTDALFLYRNLQHSATQE